MDLQALLRRELDTLAQYNPEQAKALETRFQIPGAQPEQPQSAAAPQPQVAEQAESVTELMQEYARTAEFLEWQDMGQQAFREWALKVKGVTIPDPKHSDKDIIAAQARRIAELESMHNKS